ncbi:hypothetical protein [Nostoc sp.]|uniref:hypothetical protein n=1 Tax=Nostoc sp. TaxID=1180 RepID=UPI002FF4992F
MIVNPPLSAIACWTHLTVAFLCTIALSQPIYDNFTFESHTFVLHTTSLTYKNQGSGVQPKTEDFLHTIPPTYINQGSGVQPEKLKQNLLSHQNRSQQNT